MGKWGRAHRHWGTEIKEGLCPPVLWETREAAPHSLFRHQSEDPEVLRMLLLPSHSENQVPRNSSPRNQNVNSLTPVALHDAVMWNNKKYKTTTDQSGNSDSQVAVIESRHLCRNRTKDLQIPYTTCVTERFQEVCYRCRSCISYASFWEVCCIFSDWYQAGPPISLVQRFSRASLSPWSRDTALPVI